MPRTRPARLAAQNAAFLAALAMTGNSRLAARTLGVHRSTYTKRRARDPHFAAQWQAALEEANEKILPRISGGGGPSEGRWRGPERSEGKEPPSAPNSSPAFAGEGDRAKCGGGAPSLPTKNPSTSLRPVPLPTNSWGGSAPPPPSAPLRTQGGEPVVVRLRSGRVQLRRARPGQLTKAAEQAFLRALSACANIRLAAAAAGFAHSSFYARARKSPAFAREMRLALETGYEQLDWALLAAGLPESGEDDGWRRNDPPPIPRMSPAQALQLLTLHRKTVCDGWDKPHRRRRRGESDEAHVMRLRAMWLAEQRRARDEEAVRRAIDARPAGSRAPAPPTLPDLEQVAGWSKADPAKTPHDPDRALFGGWRLEHWARRGPK